MVFLPRVYVKAKERLRDILTVRLPFFPPAPKTEFNHISNDATRGRQRLRGRQPRPGARGKRKIAFSARAFSKESSLTLLRGFSKPLSQTVFTFSERLNRECISADGVAGSLTANSCELASFRSRLRRSERPTRASSPHHLALHPVPPPHPIKSVKKVNR